MKKKVAERNRKDIERDREDIERDRKDIERDRRDIERDRLIESMENKINQKSRKTILSSMIFNTEKQDRKYKSTTDIINKLSD